MTSKSLLLLVLFSRCLSCFSFNPALPKQATLTRTTYCTVVSRPLSTLGFVRLHDDSRSSTNNDNKSPFRRNLERYETTTPEGGAALSSSESNDNDDKNKMTKAYNLSTVLFGFISILLLLSPDRTMTKRLATKIGGAAGFGLASGASYMLSRAEEEQHDDDDQLVLTTTSDTYKRLNLGVLGFSVLGLAGSIPGEAGFFRTAPPAMITALFMLVTRIVGAKVAYQGWTRGIVVTSNDVSNDVSNSTLSASPVVAALVEGMKSNIRGFRVKRQDKKKSLFYRNGMLLVMFGMFNNFMGAIFDIRVSAVQ
jgi:hypothetical protein